MPERTGASDVEAIVIGAGQAGLVTTHLLRQRGIAAIAVDANERMRESWSRRWESLRLFTPGWLDRLPGLSPKWSDDEHPGKDAVAGYLTDYACSCRSAPAPR